MIAGNEKPRTSMQRARARAHGALALATLLSTSLPASAAWNAALADDFDGPAGEAPDQSRWHVQSGNPNSSHELQCYRAEQVELDGNGHVVIESFHDPASACADTRAPGSGSHDYQSGLMSSYTTVTRDSGGAAFEFRAARTPGHHDGFGGALSGALSAGGRLVDHRCLLVDHCEGLTPRIELIPVRRGREQTTQFWGFVPERGQRTDLASRLGDGYNTFRVEWLSDRLELYVFNGPVEGQIHTTLRGNFAASALKAVFNLAIQGSSADPSRAASSANRLTIDYVRLYTLGSLRAHKTYRVHNEATGQGLEVLAGSAGAPSASSGDHVGLSHLERTSTPEQRFRLRDLGGGYYRIFSQANRALALAADGAPNARVTLRTAAHAESRFRIENSGDGYYRIKPAHDETLCLTTPDTERHGQPVALAPCGSERSQRFRFDEF